MALSKTAAEELRAVPFRPGDQKVCWSRPWRRFS